MRKADGTLSDNSEFVWSQVPIGGGGYALDFQIASNGIKYAGTDVGNGYLRRADDAKWHPIFRTDTLPPADLVHNGGALTDGYGSMCGAFAPSNPDRFYSQVNGWVYKIVIDPTKELDELGGLTLTRWNLAAKKFKTNNGAQRLWGNGISVHPTDPDIVIVGTNNDGVYYTLNGGATVSQVTGLSAPTNSPDANEIGHERNLVLIDKGNGDHVYIVVQGIGIYRSTTGVGGAFSLIAGPPVSASGLFGEADGTLWVVADSRRTAGAGIFTLARGGSSWTTKTLPSGFSPVNIAVNPLNNQHVHCAAGAPNATSIDRGATWHSRTSTGSTVFNSDGEVAWRANTTPRVSTYAFDPIVSSATPSLARVWHCDGFGVSYTTYPATSPISWTDHSIGIEEKIHNSYTVHPTTGTTIISSWDRPITRVNSLTEYVNNITGPVEDGSIMVGHFADYAIDDPNYWVSGAGSGAVRHSYSTDDGNTWHLFAPTTPFNQIYPGNSGSAGCVAVSNKLDICIVQSNNQPAIRSRDGGVTWQQISLGGRTDYHTINAFSTTDCRRLIADKSTPGKFIMVVPAYWLNPGEVWDHPAGGVWMTTDNWTTSTQLLQGVITDAANKTYSAVTSSGQDARMGYYGCDLKFVPGFPGELLWTPHSDFADDKMWKSAAADNGATWTQVHNLVRNVKKFAFGPVYPGQTRPSVVFYGKYNGVIGMWLTLDWWNTFIKVGDEHPSKVFGSHDRTGADPTVFGRFFIENSGQGSAYSTYQDVAIGT